MNQEYDYAAYKRRLDETQNWWGTRFEKQLEEIFRTEGELLETKPKLANGKTPDFLIGDAKGNSSYIEAKVRHNSAEEDKYFADWIVRTLEQHKGVDGKGIGVQAVSGKPQGIPDVDRLLQEISDWLATFHVKALREQDRRELPRKSFTLPGVEIKLVATRAHNTGRLLAYATRSRSGPITGERTGWLSRKAGEATEIYTPEQLKSTPLILAVLNLSDHPTKDADIYGNEYLQVDGETERLTKGGFCGEGVWHGNDRKEKLDTLHGIWLWHHIGTSPPAKPILYANPDIEDLILPGSLLRFKHNMRGPKEGDHIRILREDGNATYDPAVLVKAWQEYPKKRPDEVL